MQFVFLRPLTSVALVISDEFYVSRWDPSYPQLYISMITNISVFFAFTGLLRFYHAVKEDLKWCHPFSKFMSIKGVVFLTFWQKIVLSVIAHAVYEGRDDADASQKSIEWSKQAQSFLICFEMFAFAIVHCGVFPTEEWEPGFRERQKRKIKANLGDSLAIKDFVADVKAVMKSRRKGGKYKKVNHASKTVVCNDSIEEVGHHYDSKTSPSSSLIRDDDTSTTRSVFEIGDLSEDSLDDDGWNRIEEFIHDMEDVEKDNGDDDDDDDCLLPSIA